METRIDGRSLRYQHRRGELLEAVAEYVVDNGVATLSLRRIGEAVGVSHVTLQHHFGTKEQLVEEIVEHVLGRTLIPKGVYTDGIPNPDMDLPARLRALWAHLTSPPGLGDIRLFIEVVGQSLYGAPECSPAVARSMTHRLELIRTNLVSLGCPEEGRRTVAGTVDRFVAAAAERVADDLSALQVAEQHDLLARAVRHLGPADRGRAHAIRAP
jgi:AcrR family transcriptional regulator